MIFCWIAVAIVLASLGAAMIMTSSVEQLGKSGAEITQVVQHLSSADSLKTILVTYGSQYQQAEEHWMKALNLVSFLLFLVSVVALGFVGAFISATRRLHQLQEQNRRNQP